MERRIRVTVTARRTRNQFVLRWQENGKTQERKTDARSRHVAEREAAELERELAERLPSSDWAEFKERYEREQCRGNARFNWRAIVKRVEAEASVDRIDQVTASVISKAVASMRDEGRPETTIKGYLKHLRAGLSWAKQMGLLQEVPSIRMPKLRRESHMRSRPITGEEFDRLLLAVPKVKRNPEPWVQLLNAMYWGGLRIGEAAILTADWTGDFTVMLDHEPPVFKILAEGQKSRKDQLLPMAPEFYRYLQTLDVPKRGRVFRGLPMRVDSMVASVRKIGAASGIVVNDSGKTVTAHDLRRSFGTRWAKRLAPAELQAIMRHAEIQTTMRYYVDLELQELSTKLWQFDHDFGDKKGDIGNGTDAKLPKTSVKTSRSDRI